MIKYVGIMKTGKWYRYLIPKGLLIKSSVERVGYQQYRWLSFYICIKRTKKMKKYRTSKEEIDDLNKCILWLLVAFFFAIILIFWTEDIDKATDIWRGHPSGFHNTEEYRRYVNVIKVHGDVAVASDFSHFIRLNGEVVYNKGRW